MRLDHGAIAALMVPTPTAAIIATLHHILTRHNPIEEGPDGLYAVCDRLLAPKLEAVLGDIEALATVNVSPHNDAPGVLPAVERALERAGYRLVR